MKKLRKSYKEKPTTATKVVVFNKPFNVLTQFTGQVGDLTLAKYIPIKEVYPAGRLDKDSEGLLVLTNDGKLQAKITQPRFKAPKTYWVQVDGDITIDAIEKLQRGVILKDGLTKPAKVRKINEPDIWERNPPIRTRKNIPTSWIEIIITEGRNRQVRRMTANVGFPTLRLIRYAIGKWNLAQLQPGQYKEV